jgi:hypothetical protein
MNRKVKNATLKYLYNISLDQYEKKLEEQGGICCLCGCKEKAKKSLSVDHDHKTDQIRGLLCMWCNTKLGTVESKLWWYIRAVDYLQYWNLHQE